MKIIRERKFEPIKIFIDSPEELTFLLNVFIDADINADKRCWFSGPDEYLTNLRAYKHILEGYRNN